MNWQGKTPTADQLREILEKHAAWTSGSGGDRANLYGANLDGANLVGANLSRANLTRLLATRRICPESGAFVAYKKLAGGAIAELLIPATAERVGGVTGRKCRASEAVVVAITLNGQSIETGISDTPYYRVASYRVGATVRPDSFDPNPLVECAPGIHFFISRLEAEEYR